MYAIVMSWDIEHNAMVNKGTSTDDSTFIGVGMSPNVVNPFLPLRGIDQLCVWVEPANMSVDQVCAGETTGTIRTSKWLFLSICANGQR